MSTRSKNTMMLMYSGRGRMKSEEGVALDNAEEDDGDKREYCDFCRRRAGHKRGDRDCPKMHCTRVNALKIKDQG